MTKIRLEQRNQGYDIYELNPDGTYKRCLDTSVAIDRYGYMDLSRCLQNCGQLFGVVVCEIFMKYPKIKGYKVNKVLCNYAIKEAFRVPVPAKKVSNHKDNVLKIEFVK